MPKHKGHWSSVIYDLTEYTMGGGPPPQQAFDRLMRLSKEEGIPRWAIVAAVAEAEGVARKDMAYGKPTYDFDIPEIEAAAREKHATLGCVREANDQGMGL